MRLGEESRRKLGAEEGSEERKRKGRREQREYKKYEVKREGADDGFEKRRRVKGGKEINVLIKEKDDKSKKKHGGEQ